MDLVWWAAIGYVFGSIPFGLLMTSLAGLGDIRKIGSGNIGATNVLRTGNKTLAVLTLLLDALKGFAPVFLAAQYSSHEAMLWAGAGALAGHIWPIWLKFRGGKGVATAIGVLFAFDWRLGAMFITIWGIAAILFRISSLSALLAAVAIPIVALALGLDHLVWPACGLALVIWVKHLANIRRLMAGIEPKISFSPKK